MTTIMFKGKLLHLVGTLPRVGETAPIAPLTAQDLSNQEFKPNKKTVLFTLPSLDTPTCDLEGRRFNEAAVSLGPHIDIIAVSMDLPFAQKRWCGAHGVDRIKTFSDYRTAEFGKAYGVLIKEWHLLARAVFLIDSKGIIRYVEVVPEVSEPPQYEKVLSALEKM